MVPLTLSRLSCAAILGAAVSAGAVAQDIKLPTALTVTAYDTGSSGFSMTVAIGKMMKEKHGADLRVLPAGNDIARLSPLKSDRAQISAMGVGSYFAAEGVFEFASKGWGPQPLQMMLASTSCNALSLGVAKDAGVKEIKDLKGKRVGFVVGSPALNQNALAVLAYGGLTKQDVSITEFSSYGAMWKGVLNNEIDAAFASTVAGQAREVDASPRGLMWPPAPATDKAAWERVKKVGPFFYPHKATCGAGGLSPSNPVELPAYPYPIIVAYATQKPDLVYAFTKSMIVNYDAYKDGARGVDGFAVDRQNLEWVLPYHPGAVKALKEAGVWTPAAQKHNDALLARQKTLADAWAAFEKASPPDDKDAFTKAWMTARKQALDKAGMDPVFD